MTDLTEPFAISPPVTNSALQAEDAAGQTVAAIAEADKISAGKSNSIGSYSNRVAVLNFARRRNSPL
jgi:ubiquitin-like 1-activating enzyme E1 A